ncbi:hypothetical protein QF117_09155 [Vibrio sp. YMD68]|uniref:hypothetical protein n=1 Tax=Vibrio sp. YMD68 TaxID=3042300 RepID=UPI00249C127E|nr:hypothetical protein [Vibrio sp. YMD68]WGW00350.1 hypothetical protein QF117_21220 [Vibrio sp. YMD68]WGW00969.1 hypothetical protein QF117_09155 [Vibrio sp. YMD68]
MSIEKTLASHAGATVLETGRFLYVRKASAPISVTLTSDVDNGQAVEVKLQRGEQYDIGEFSPTARFTRLEIKNLSSEINLIELEVGYHRFTPSISGSDINATITGSTIDLPVEVVKPIEVQKVIDPIDVQKVVEPIEVKKESKRLIDLGKHTIDVQGQISIGDNTQRYELIMVCASTNQGMVLANGVPLLAGQSFILTSDKAVTMTGLQNDEVYVSEVCYE